MTDDDAWWQGTHNLGRRYLVAKNLFDSASLENYEVRRIAMEKAKKELEAHNAIWDIAFDRFVMLGGLRKR